MSILTDKWVKTRKEHRCFGCSEKFPAGTRMKHQVNVCEDFFSFYTCEPCQGIISNHFDALKEGDGLIHEDCVRESMEAWKVETHEELGKALDDYEKYLKDMRKKSKEMHQKRGGNQRWHLKK